MYDDEYESMKDLKSKKKKSILDDLEEVENLDYNAFAPSPKTNQVSSFLPSSMLKEQKSNKKKKEKDDEEYDPDAWFNELMGAHNNIEKTRKRIKNDLFTENGINLKKKKKKNKNKGEGNELTDFKREFEPEMALYKNLLVAQNRFTDSLQKEYDGIKSVKSSSRGITKQMSDLVENITEARALSMQLVDKHVNAKKLIAELTLKQQKELGKSGLEGENMADFASNYLKQMINNRQALLDPTGNSMVSDLNDDEMIDEIGNLFNSDPDDEGRSDEVEKYLKYEHRNVIIYVLITDDDIENYEFIAKGEDGEIIEDYPMPNHTNISVNRSTNIATDYFGQKYPIIWE